MLKKHHGSAIDKTFEYAQSISKENSDNEDDIIYDYAPAA